VPRVRHTASDIATSRAQSPKTVDWEDALHGCQVDWGATREAQESRTRPMENEQPSGPSVTHNADRQGESRAQPMPLREEAFVTIGRVEQPSGLSVTASTTDDADTHRESGAQPTLPRETPDANGPDTQPRDVSPLQGDYPERFD